MAHQVKQNKSVKLTKDQIKKIRLKSITDEVNESTVIRNALDKYFKN